MDAIDACSNSEFGILWQRDALDDELHIRGITQAFYVIPVHGRVSRVDARWNIEALEHGVPLLIGFAMELRAADTLALLADQYAEYEIRYLPLSQHYQLNEVGSDDVTTYPRLRHVLAELSRRTFNIETGPLFIGEYTLRGRVVLDQTGLPAPMQLPAALSGQWRHDTEWNQWQFRINA